MREKEEVTDRASDISTRYVSFATLSTACVHASHGVAFAETLLIVRDLPVCGIRPFRTVRPGGMSTSKVASQRCQIAEGLVRDIFNPDVSFESAVSSFQKRVEYHTSTCPFRSQYEAHCEGRRRRA